MALSSPVSREGRARPKVTEQPGLAGRPRRTVRVPGAPFTPLSADSSPERTCRSFSSYPGLLKPVPGGAGGECRDPDACRGLEGAEGFSLEKYGRLQKAGKPGSGGAGAAF